MAWQDSFTAAGSWSDSFGPRGSGFHHGTDLARLTIYAWEGLTVLDSDYFSPALGYGTILKAADGTRFGVFHNRKGTRPANGKVLKPGDVIAQAASGPKSLAQSNPNFPGNDWDGAHFHITQVPDGYNPANWAGVTDPRPRIMACVEGRPLPGPGSAWAFNPPVKAVQESIQFHLKARKRYNGPVDGAWGKESIKGIQRTIENVGYTGLIDGIPGPSTCYYIQVYAQKFGDYKGDVDRILGPNSWAGFNLGLERP